ncbi:uncharacterized protein LOC123311978 isoform X2 [Coccinella septempunctata]|uniref:uncharacterized protein LOC123311978 isoform X2 n=1 Tax=Coccinella septempunctata TaxID=41139 RepID=UPI001D05F6A6|nr:uncharacterized protein LOC123311978 isoform X2 [Coccinella septempunctata]XP_044752063.1 uncharacterized protein LOC123311978 isoform X2 [Coccinella septempunctata]
MYVLICAQIFLLFLLKSYADDIFEADLAEDFKIGLAEKGYKSVKLKCGANHMILTIETDEDFTGVIYTRGNFYDKNFPCFVDAAKSENKRNFTMKFNLRECNTKKRKDRYLNTLVLQHDHELIMPGDAAFSLECDFKKFRETTDTLVFVEKYVTSRIGLTNADPADKSKSLPMVDTGTNTAILTPSFYKKHKDEL